MFGNRAHFAETKVKICGNLIVGLHLK